MTGAPQIRVLVVDDSVVVRRLVADSLAESPLITVVGVAHNGKMALEKVRDLEPDAVTMDIEMPVMDGIQAVRASSNIAGRPTIPRSCSPATWGRSPRAGRASVTS